ncbi:MAG: hypothetical protein ACM3II_00110 [Rhodospirillaceae bacterium]
MSKYVVQATWDDVPHIDDAAKRSLADSYPPHERDARMRGVPQLGAGAIYPVPESEIICDPFEWPYYWRQVYALDVGWNRTAAVWAVYDGEHGIAYLTSEHYRGGAEPAIHAQAIRARGDWIPGVIDPAARGRGQHDGSDLMTMYGDLGLHLTAADNSVETGIYEVWTRLSTGRLKVFSTLANWRAEYRLYRRDDRGRIVKQDDHLMDATRYLVMTGLDISAFKPQEARRVGMRADYRPMAQYEEQRGGMQSDYRPYGT